MRYFVLSLLLLCSGYVFCDDALPDAEVVELTEIMQRDHLSVTPILLDANGNQKSWSSAGSIVETERATMFPNEDKVFDAKHEVIAVFKSIPSATTEVVKSTCVKCQQAERAMQGVVYNHEPDKPVQASSRGSCGRYRNW